jgi:hypothetical protein
VDGFAQHYGAAALGDLPGYLESYSGGDDTAHAWRFQLGPQSVLVIGLSEFPSAAQIKWAEGVLDRNAELPTILLAHRFFGGIPVDYQKPLATWKLVERRAHQIFMAVWGHVSPGEVEVVDVNGYEILRIRTNFQMRPPFDLARESIVNLVRFHIGPTGIDSVEVRAFSPLQGYYRNRIITLPRRRFDRVRAIDVRPTDADASAADTVGASRSVGTEM